jgi:hypothetical protein
MARPMSTPDIEARWLAARIQLRLAELRVLAAQTSVIVGRVEEKKDLIQMKRFKTIDDETDPFMRAVYELQFSLEGVIEDLKMQRANFANAVAILQEQRQQRRTVRLEARH